MKDMRMTIENIYHVLYHMYYFIHVLIFNENVTVQDKDVEHFY